MSAPDRNLRAPLAPDGPCKIRVSIDMTAAAFRRLEELEASTDAASKASLIRQALLLYEYVTRCQSRGARILVEEAGASRELVILLGGHHADP